METITEWDPSSLVEYATVILTARRRSGKSFLTRRIIYENRKKYTDIYIFSQTIDAPANRKDFEFIPAENRYNHLDEEKIRDIITTQQEILEYNDGRPKNEHIESHPCIILDDILTDTSFRKQNGIVTELFVQGRHTHITLMIAVQSFSGREGVHPVLRKNADLLISFFQHNINDRKNIAEQYLSVIDVKEGQELFRQITNEAHTACIIDVNNTKARQYNEYIYKYKAPDTKIPEFTIGGKEKRMSEIQLPKQKPPKKEKILLERINSIQIKKSVKVSKQSKNKITVRTCDVRINNEPLCEPSYNI